MPITGNESANFIYKTQQEKSISTVYTIIIQYSVIIIIYQTFMTKHQSMALSE